MNVVRRPTSDVRHVMVPYKLSCCYYFKLDMFPREFTKLKYTKLGTDHSPCSQEAGKVSCNKTAL